MDWTNVVQISKCKFVHSNFGKVEIFSYEHCHLIFAYEEKKISMYGDLRSISQITAYSILLKALHTRLYLHPARAYFAKELTLFDNSEECVSDLYK